MSKTVCLSHQLLEHLQTLANLPPSGEIDQTQAAADRDDARSLGRAILDLPGQPTNQNIHDHVENLEADLAAAIDQSVPAA